MKNRIGRRGFIKASAALAAWPNLSLRGDTPVAEENSKPGTVEWQLQFTRFDDPITLASYPLIRETRSSLIEGYASKASVRPGESIDFKVSLDPVGTFLIDIYRMGYYGATGGRHMVRLGPFKGEPQPMPMMTVQRLRECRWESCTSFIVPSEWPSGVYLAKLTREDAPGFQSYVIFVVKEHRPSDLLYQVSDLTWQAYNKWPGRDSLYDDGTPEVWYTGPHVRVSFDRPYAKYCQIVDAPLSAGSGEFLLWEHPMVYWLEQQGYDLTYCSNLDLHLDPKILAFSKAFLSVGHDEYWSRKMFDEALKARDEGLSFAFFSGNSLCHEILFYDSGVDGAPARAFARDKLFEDEKNLMGLSSYGPGYGDWVVTRPEHWIYEGTGVKEGHRVPGLARRR
ncbi:MAG: N,N-dimethylformamidase beta subunit family domain-containing protein [Acidobacteriota bacterium]